MKKRLLQILYLTLLATACASTKTYIISGEVQEKINAMIKSRDYQLFFTQPYVEDNHFTEISGNIRIQGDTLWYMFWHPVYKIVEKFLIHDYKPSISERGEILVSFYVMRYDEKQKKEVPLPFFLKMYTPSRIDVTIDDDTYFGALNGNYLHFNL